MYHCLKNTRHHPFLPFLKTFPPTKHRNAHFSSFAIPNPNDNPNHEPIPANFPCRSPPESPLLVPTSNITSKPPTALSCNRSPPFDSHNHNDIVSSNKIITSCIRSGDIDSALRVFNNMTVRTTVTWNSILAGYSKAPGKIKEAQQLFDRIPEKDAVSYNIMLGCYC
ncbi:hypothetical protein CCACVL1_05256 [Corchorus capsularis]|uniref:Pentatricopeptide repeat-containing protein n=1 Tax=Corchorus capsularis TaxID=210143 RepID=A0A1R3JLQ1_COCAP|nr:hypothetical protein CCACVL1_05256 [Corchorus capsularis]